MSSKHSRMAREAKTIRYMMEIYCRGQHSTENSLCPECAELHDYALARLARCPFQEAKSTCANCTVHCYKPEMRQRVREAMRYAGPRMLWRHPILALTHLLIDGRRPAPALAGKKPSA